MTHVVASHLSYWPLPYPLYWYGNSRWTEKIAVGLFDIYNPYALLW